jgi:mRNA interferase MazF
VVAKPAPYVPAAGDVVWVSFDPAMGHEQAGRRPGLVLSPIEYNARCGLMLICPITSKVKNYPFEVALPPGTPISGVVVADHVRNMDWRARQVEFACQAPPEVLREVRAKLAPLLSSRA